MIPKNKASIIPYLLLIISPVILGGAAPIRPPIDMVQTAAYETASFGLG